MELKQCPFCDGKAEVCEGGISGRMRVYGLVEHKDGCFFFVDGLPTRYQHIMESEFDAWNTRAERTCTLTGNTWQVCNDTTWRHCSECDADIMEGKHNYCWKCGAKVVDA